MPATRDASEVTRGDAPALQPIGAVARQVGLTPRAIRYYEEAGLLRPAIRVKGADRLFDASDVQRLRDIKRMREVIGFSTNARIARSSMSVNLIGNVVGFERNQFNTGCCFTVIPT